MTAAAGWLLCCLVLLLMSTGAFVVFFSGYVAWAHLVERLTGRRR